MAVLAEAVDSMAGVRAEGDSTAEVAEGTSAGRVFGAESHLDYGNRVAGRLGRQVDGEIAGAATPLILGPTRLARMAGQV